MRATARAVALSLIAVTLLVTSWMGTTTAYLDETLTAIAIAVWLLAGGRRRDALRRTRVFLLLALVAAIASGVTVLVGQLVMGKLPPQPWVDDWMLLCYPAFAVTGLLLIPTPSRQVGHRARALADGAVAASAMWYLLMSLPVDWLTEGTQSAVARGVMLAFPICDIFVVSTALTVLSRCAPDARRIVGWMTLGLASLAFSDLWLAKSADFTIGGWARVVYEGGLLMLVVAAAAPPVHTTGERSAQPWVAPVLEGLPFLPLLASMVWTTRMVVEGDGMPQRQVLPALAVAAALVARSFTSSQEKERLVTALRARESRLTAALRRDELTGMSNRVGLFEQLDTVLADPQRWPVSLALLDLDDFKLINDNHGHDVGDEILRIVAARLRRSVRDEDVIARLGGDEFAVVATELHDDDAGFTTRLLACFDEPMQVGSRKFAVRASIGIVTARRTDTPAALLAHADAAMYQAKERQARSSQVEVLADDCRASVASRLRIREDIGAPVREEFHVVYQPVVELATGRIRGIEALLRWQHPELGNVPPAVFIPLAEQSGTIGLLGAWVFETAMGDIAATRAQRPDRQLTVSINVSPRQLTDETFVELAVGLMRRHALPPGAVVLEITEQALETDLEALAAAAARLRCEGILIAVDDFGTGYSSLRYLQHLPLDIMKIDRSFVSGIDSGDSNCALVSSIAEMADRLGLLLVAEGIESLEQLRILRTMKCPLGQGYLFSVPVSIEEIQRVLRSSDAYPVAVAPVPGELPVQRRSASQPIEL